MIRIALIAFGGVNIVGPQTSMKSAAAKYGKELNLGLV